MEGAQSYAALARIIQVERFSPTYIVTQGPLSPTLYIRSERSPSHIAAGRNSSTLPDLPYILWDKASNHRGKKPLNPYMVVMTLHAIYSHSS
jgi:hypothetical protein